MSTSTLNPYPANTMPQVRKANVVPRNLPPHKFLENKSDEDLRWDAGEIGARDLLFIRNCSNLTLAINTPFTKLLIGAFYWLVFAIRPTRIATALTFGSHRLQNLAKT